MRRQCRVAATLGLWAAVTLLAACAALQNAAPRTPAEAMAYAYATIEAGYNTNTKRMESRAISGAEGKVINATLDTAMDWVDLAREAARVGDLDSVPGYLRLATIVLDELERRALQ